MWHDLPMNDDAQRLLKEAEISAERSMAYVRCALGLAVATNFFVVVVPTLKEDNPALGLVPYFTVFCIGYVGVGILTIVAARPQNFRGWMTWLFTTLDLCFWSGLLVAIVIIIELPASHILVLPPTLIVFVILSLVALRNNPWLQAYSLTFVVVALVVLYFVSPKPDFGLIENDPTQVGFFELPLNIVRLSLVALTGLVLVILSVRTRRLLNRAVDETVRRVNLSRYLPPQIADRLAQTDRDSLMRGRSQNAAVLFVDIRGFTTLAEEMDAEVLGQFLTSYREIISGHVHANEGLVDKFVGDSVMAVFGVTDTGENDAANALECAMGIIRSISEWSPKGQGENVLKISVGIGAHWGTLFCGAIGDSSRLEFTVLGDTVNVAARLEKMTKELGCSVVVSHAILVSAGLRATPQNGWKSVGNITIRGRREPIPIYAYS
jgi:adenylate cyclase